MKILLMTGYADQRERCENLAKRIIDVVDKPFSLPDIRKRSPWRSPPEGWCCASGAAAAVAEGWIFRS